MVDAAALADRLGFRLSVVRDAEGVCVASAHRLANGDRFGPPFPADSEEEAAARLVVWLEWQHDHTAALSALQEAEAVYHRLAVKAFAGEGSSHRADVQAALASLEAARRTLDAIRERYPWPS